MTRQGSERPAIENLRVLVIEDEYLVALEMIDALLDAGFGKVVHAETESAALHQLKHGQWNAVVADANLNGTSIAQVGSVLVEQAIPFVVVTGYDRDRLPVEVRDAPLFSKPFSADELANSVRQLCGL